MGELLQLAADRDAWRREVLRIDPSLLPHNGCLGNDQIAPPISLSAGEWLEGATKMDGQSSGGHVKWAQKQQKQK